MKHCLPVTISIALLSTFLLQSVWTFSSRDAMAGEVCRFNATTSPDITKHVSGVQHDVCSTAYNTELDEGPRFTGIYDFSRKSIPRVHVTDDSVLSYMRARKPVVITGADVLGPAQTVWNVEYLKNNVLSSNLTVYVSETRRFLYYDMQRKTEAYRWNPPHRKMFTSFSEFCEIVKQLQLSSTNHRKAYLQTALNVADLSDEMQDHIFQFDYVWLNSLAQKLQWGDIDTNLLLVGMPDVVTPAHYDGMENIFAQVSGHKRCILFSPLQYRNLYPHPVHHPHDRQTQVNFDAPDYEKFPRFRDALGYEAIVGPGDLLYIPLNWWHYIESNIDSMTISINFWFPSDFETSVVNSTMSLVNSNLNEEKSQPEDINPTTEEELLQLMREIESSVGENLKDIKQVKDFLMDIIDRRFDFV